MTPELRIAGGVVLAVVTGTAIAFYSFVRGFSRNRTGIPG